MTAQLKGIVGRVLGIAPQDVADNLGPKTAGHWTSLKHVQLIAAVEDEYHIRFTPREIRSVRTVAELSDLVQAKIGAR